MKRLLGWLAGFAMTVVSGAHAAEINLTEIPGSADILVISGEITSGDSDRFYEAVKHRDRVVVYLQSPGGLVREALQIGAEIRYRGFATAVADGDACFSACGLIWLSGARRYMSAGSLLGFHAAYREEAGEFRESGVANAEIGSFLTHLGLRIEAIRFFTVAGPTDFLLLTPQRARTLGIDIFLIDGADIVSPQDAPTGDRYAERWVLYNVLRSQCQGYFRSEIGVIERGLEAAFAGGNDILGAEQWVNIWTGLLDQWASKIRFNGHVTACVEAEYQLRAQGMPTGIAGPSFDCSEARTPAERAICSDQDLWAKDRAMNAIYFWIRDNVERDLRGAILTVQRSWLAVRNDCGSDRDCLNGVYDQRLEELKLVVVQ